MDSKDQEIDESLKDNNESFNTEDDNSAKFEKLSCFYLYKKYFKEVYVRMQQFKDELLASTLEFALSLPKELVENYLNEIFACLEVNINNNIILKQVLKTFFS
jgi:hypothetical protein